AIYMAVARCTPLTNRIVTISGDAVSNPQNFNVPIGTDFGEIVEAAGGFKAQPEKIVFGGPMMGMAMYTYHIPVTKITSSLVSFLQDEAAVEESPCIRCGRCLEHCPLQLA
ncbi:MAG TPA: electron transporter RnfC, partial [Lachnospiraceae bacterium]|nr:electron transporter RnfC [Lachnospiraceae bacterium]